MNLILEIFVIFAAAKLAGEVFVRLRQPAIAGELLVGVVLGPHALGVVHVDQATTVLAELGIVVLLFTAGLEMRVSDVVAVGRSSLAASAVGMLLAAGTGFALVRAFGFGNRAAAVAGVALAASSVGIAARAFADMGNLRSRAARVVLGAAVLDDVVVLAVLPATLGVAAGSAGVGPWVGLAGAAGFMVLVVTVGSGLARRHGRLMERPRTHRAPFVLALALCLGLAALAEQIGLAALVGAFLAGMVLAETSERYRLERRMEPLFDFLVPFFFVISAAQLDPASLSGNVGLIAAVVLATIAAKLAGCAAGAFGLGGWRERLVAGAGMIPRGEVTIAAAAAGLASGVLPATVFSALLAAVFVTTLVAPLLLRALVPAAERREHPPLEVPPEASGLEE